MYSVPRNFLLNTQPYNFQVTSTFDVGVNLLEWSIGHLLSVEAIHKT